MSIELRYKSPTEKVVFAVDWADYLVADTITSSTWILPSGITQVTSNFTATRANIMLQGGTLGATYRVTNRINTSAGEIVEQSVDIQLITK
jgi:hypothetical protein